MLYTYATKRITLKILGEEAAGLVTEFFFRNRDFFSPWETNHHQEYFTVSYQRRILNAESSAFLRSQFVRYYLFLPWAKIPIGTVSFQHIRPWPDASCQIGYRLDQEYTGHGYMSEALICLIPKIFFYYRLHRIEADILPSNTSSIRLIERMNFTLEGTSRGRYLIGRTFQDHLRYSLLSDDPFPAV